MSVVISHTIVAYYINTTDKTIHAVYTLHNSSAGSVDVGEIDCEIFDAAGNLIGSGFFKTSDLVTVNAGDYIQYETNILINTIALHAYRARASVNIAGSTYSCQYTVTKDLPRE